VQASKSLTGPKPQLLKGDQKAFVNDVRAALYCSKICSYAQGFAMIAAANKQFGYGMKLDEISRIWKAGCIIRAIFLDEIKKAFREHPTLTNLLMTDRFKTSHRPASGRLAADHHRGRPERHRHPRLQRQPRLLRRLPPRAHPANLIQAQRDFFGAHTYERTDKPGIFHTEYTPGNRA